MSTISQEDISQYQLDEDVQKYMSFGIGDERFAIPILTVQEIISPTSITRVPKSPKFLKGVMNLRGKIVPILDLRIRLGKPERPADERTCFIVARALLKSHEMSVGLIVDCVLGVSAFKQVQQPNRVVGTNGEELAGTDYIAGIAIDENSVTMLIDIDSLLLETPEVALS